MLPPDGSPSLGVANCLSSFVVSGREVLSASWAAVREPQLSLSMLSLNLYWSYVNHVDSRSLALVICCREGCILYTEYYRSPVIARVIGLTGVSDYFV